jgi:DNA sulfur modification protein DndD
MSTWAWTEIRMHINSIAMRNFGPFLAEERIEFASGSQPVTLVYGENMSGKTSLLNAIRWGLYGVVRGRTGAHIPLQKLLNVGTRRQGSYSFSVEIEIEDMGTVYLITRQAESSRDPRGDGDFETTLHVRKDGKFLSAEEGRRLIHRLLPEEVAHFYLFDGEMLNDFEDLLSDATQQADLIKRSVEEILGVPALENTIEDLQLLLKDAQKRRDKTAQSVAAAEQDANKAQEIADRVSAAEQDNRDLEQQLDDAKSKAEEAEAGLKEFAGIEADIGRLGEWRDKEREAVSRIGSLEEERRVLLSNAWRDILHAAVSDTLETREREFETLRAVSRETARIRAERALLEKAINEAASQGTCPLCEQQLGTAHEAHLRERLNNMPEEQSSDSDAEERLAVSISRLKRVDPKHVGRTVLYKEVDLRRARVESTKAHNRIIELETKLREHDLTEVARLQKEHEKLVKQQGAVEEILRDTNDRLAKLRSEAAQVRARISKVSDPQIDRLNREVDCYESLLKTFESSLNNLRDQLKGVVESAASEIFLQLTTDESYKGLRINDSYGLYIVDANGQDVVVRSAGAEQVVALSLIGALNRNAIKQGPVMMDTPFGRLDKRHRLNILSFLSTMTDQVVLLVHSGEVDRERDLEVVKPHVQREYELEHVSSSQTRIVPVGEVGA